MRSMRKVSLTFSLVSVPCKVYKAADANEIAFRQIHNADCGRIRQKRFCEVCDEEVAYADIQKGFELADRMIPVTDDDLAALPIKSSRELAIESFIPADEIDPIYMSGAHYYLGPDAGGDKAYALVAGSLAKSGKLALAKAALHGRERVSVIRAVNGVLVMDMLSWPDEIRDAGEVPFKETPKPDDKETDLALQLIDALSGHFDPSQFTDEYATAVNAMVERKMSDPDTPAPATEVPAQPAAGPNMADTLSAAVEAVAKERKRSTRKKAS